MFKIGLTGGIASGKSTVSSMFLELEIPVVDADIASRKVVEKGAPALQEIAASFGEDVLLPDGQLDRKRLGAVIFSDPTKREQLNKIVHPRVREWMKGQIKMYEEENRPAIVLDIPLLIENKLGSWSDKILLVYVSEAIQLQRLMDRDQISEEEALKRIHSQMPLEDKKEAADRLINNEGTLLETKNQLLKILEDWQVF